ncbi:MAG TPA: FAD-binding oxidoreductase [Vicinamibacterales bacterium]
MGINTGHFSLEHPRDPRSVPETIVNDVHSRLNRTHVHRLVRPQSIREVQELVHDAFVDGQRIAVAGGRHAMGGQQFVRRGLLADMTSMTRVDVLDNERGLVTVEAGVDWIHLVHHLLWAGAGTLRPWSIIQKQTGADRMTIGGALASNIHGRGLAMRPFIDNIESFDIVRPDGTLVTCSRTAHRELFCLAIGGYGLFGIVVRVTLRLAHRHKVQRRVAIMRADDLPAAFAERIRDGYEVGDFQFAIDPASREFMQVGVFSCYRPVEDDVPLAADQRALDADEWRRLLLLAHTEKSRAFAEYARHYMSTDGQIYWSDTHQLSQYIEGYHDALDEQVGAGAEGSEVITELYVPRADLPAFMAATRADARRHGMNVVYGTVRLIERDDESFLAWARRPWACIVFNLHVDHTPAGIAKGRDDMRRLIDAAADFGGSYYLTYHRWATRAQVERCHPRFREFLHQKALHDPRGIFTSDWHQHHVALFEGREEEPRS